MPHTVRPSDTPIDHREDAEGGALCIHVRRTLASDGTISMQRTVRCAERGEVFILSCLFCTRGGGIRDAGNGRRVVLCQAPTPKPPPSTHGHRRDDHVRLRLARPPEASPTEETVAALMTPTVLCVRADVDVVAMVRLLVEHTISALPVVDAEGRPIGIVSKTDLILILDDRELPTPAAEGLRAVDLMTSLVFTIPEDTPVGSAAALMAYEGIHHLPIVSNEGRVVGIVSSLDVLRWSATRAGFVVPPRDISGRDERDGS